MKVRLFLQTQELTIIPDPPTAATLPEIYRCQQRGLTAEFRFLCSAFFEILKNLVDRKTKLKIIKQ